MQPSEKLLSRYGLMIYRGPRTSIAGYPAADAPEEITREWEQEFGQRRNKLLGPLQNHIEAAEARVPAERRGPGSDFYEQTRRIIQKYDSAAAKYATLIIDRRNMSSAKLGRKPSIRERRSAPVYVP